MVDGTLNGRKKPRELNFVISSQNIINFRIILQVGGGFIHLFKYLIWFSLNIIVFNLSRPCYMNRNFKKFSVKRGGQAKTLRQKDFSSKSWNLLLLLIRFDGIIQSLSDIRYRTGPSAIAYLEFSRIADSYRKIVYTTGSRVENYRHRVLH